VNTNLESSIPVSTKPKGNVRWKISIWLLIGGIINYLDRSNLSIAAPAMMKELHLTNADIGLLGTVFSWTYAFMQLPSGWLVDRIGSKKMYVIAITWWSFATAATGLCNNLSTLLVGRAVLGIGEAPCMPTSAKVTSYWFPKKERGLASGVWDSASKVGPAIAAPILVTILLLSGWRSLFFITGAIGLVFALVFAKFYKTPNKSKSLSTEEFEYIKAGGAGEEKSNVKSTVKWKELFKYRSVWGMILGFFCIIWIFNIFIVFTPLYLVKTQHITFSQLGIWASIPWIGGIFGDLIGGYISTRLVEKKSMDPMVAKRAVISVAAVIAGAVTICIPFATNIKMTVLLMAAAIGCIACITGNAWALAGDVAPEELVASVGSIQNFGGYFGGALSPFIVGLIADSTGSFTLAFVSGGIVAAGAAICYWFIVREPITVNQNN